MGLHEIQGHGYCCFRIEITNHMPGCVLRLGKDTPCYSTDEKPLKLRENEYFCPLLPNVTISQKTYSEVEELVNYIFTIQDRENTTLNLWPMITGIGNSRNRATTPRGKTMEKLSMKVREKLDEIIFEME